MKLYADNIASLKAAGKLTAVISGGQDIIVISRNDMERVDKVESFLSGKAVENCRRLFDMDFVPADMGNRQICFKPDGFTWK